MAKNYKTNGRSRKIRNVRRTRKTTRRKNRANELTSLAYKMGQVNRGLNNPDSRISEAYNSGNTKPEKRVKKTLF